MSFFIDLPFDAGVSQGHGFNAIDFDHPPIEDWKDFDLQGFLRMPPLPEPAARPCVSLFFHRVIRSVQPPLTNVATILGPELFGGLDDVELPELTESRSVVVAIRIVPYDGAEFGNEWLHEQFAVVLQRLNRNLLALGAAADDHSIGPITERQLPPIIAGLQGDMRTVKDARVQDLNPFVLLLHNNEPKTRTADHDASVINHAIAISERGERGPLFAAMEFMFSARRSFDAGLYAQAVIESGTAIEVLTNRVVLGIQLAKGTSSEAVNRLLENTAFRNLLKDHLAPRLSVIVDREANGPDPLNTWLRIAYQLRNRVAHEGYRPTEDDALTALRLCDQLIHFVVDNAETNSSLGISFPTDDELLSSLMLDERSLASDDGSSSSIARRRVFDRGLKQLKAGETDAAKAAFEEADRLGSAGGAYNLAVILLREGNEREAMSALTRATERKHPVAPAYLGVYLLKNGDTDAAREALAETPPGHPQGSAVAAYFLGVIADSDNQLEDAAYHYRNASTYDDSQYAAEAAFRRGAILRELNDPGAAEAFARAVVLGEPRAASNLAALRLAAGDVDGAISAYQQGLELSVPEPALHGMIAFNLAALLERLERVQEAQPIYRQAADDGEPYSRLRLAAFAASKGDIATAKAHLDAVAAIDADELRDTAASLAEELGIELGTNA